MKVVFGGGQTNVDNYDFFGGAALGPPPGVRDVMVGASEETLP